MEKRTDTSYAQALIQAQEQKNLVSKLINLKSTVDRKQPKSFNHLTAGKVNQRNDKLKRINADNIMMLKKIMGIMQRKPADKGLDNLQRGFVTSTIGNHSMQEMMMLQNDSQDVGNDLGAFFNPNWSKQYFTKQENSPQQLSNNNGQRRKPQNPFQNQDGRSRDLGEIEQPTENQSLMEDLNGVDEDYGEQQPAQHEVHQHHQQPNYQADPFANDNIVVSSMFDHTQEQSTDSVGFQNQSVTQPQRSTWQAMPQMSVLKQNTQLIYPGEVSLNHIARKREITRINKDNAAILKKIKEVKSTINTKQQLESYKNIQKFKKLVGKSAKPRTVGKSQPRPRITQNFNQMSAANQDGIQQAYASQEETNRTFLPDVNQRSSRPSVPKNGVFNRSTSQGKRMGSNFAMINKRNPGTSGSQFRPTVNSYSGSQLKSDSQQAISTQHATSYAQGEVEMMSTDNYGFTYRTSNSIAARQNYNAHLQKSPLLAHVMDTKRLPKSIVSRVISDRDAKKVKAFNETKFDIAPQTQLPFGVPLSAKHEQRPFSNPWNQHQIPKRSANNTYRQSDQATRTQYHSAAQEYSDLNEQQYSEEPTEVVSKDEPSETQFEGTEELGGSTVDQKFRSNNMGFFPQEDPVPVNQQYYQEVEESGTSGEGLPQSSSQDGQDSGIQRLNEQNQPQQMYEGQINQQSSIQSNLDSKVSRNVIAISDQNEGQVTTEDNYTDDYYSMPAESKTQTNESKQSPSVQSKQTVGGKQSSKAPTEEVLQRDTQNGEMTGTEEQYSLPSKSQATTTNEQPSSLHNIDSTNGSKVSVAHGPVTNPGAITVTTTHNNSASTSQQRNKVSSYESTRQLEKNGSKFTVDPSVKSMKEKQLESVDDDDGEVGDEYSFEEDSVEKTNSKQEAPEASQDNVSQSVKKLTEDSIEKEVVPPLRESQETVMTGAARAQDAFSHSGRPTRLSMNTGTVQSRMSHFTESSAEQIK